MGEPLEANSQPGDYILYNSDDTAFLKRQQHEDSKTIRGFHG